MPGRPARRFRRGPHLLAKPGTDSGHEVLAGLYHDQLLIGFHGIAGVDQDPGDPPRIGGHQLVFHLHGFNAEQRGAAQNRVTCAHIDFYDSARHGRAHFGPGGGGFDPIWARAPLELGLNLQLDRVAVDDRGGEAARVARAAQRPLVSVQAHSEHVPVDADQRWPTLLRSAQDFGFEGGAAADGHGGATSAVSGLQAEREFSASEAYEKTHGPVWVLTPTPRGA